MLALFKGLGFKKKSGQSVVTLLEELSPIMEPYRGVSMFPAESPQGGTGRPPPGQEPSPSGLTFQPMQGDSKQGGPPSSAAPDTDNLTHLLREVASKAEALEREDHRLRADMLDRQEGLRAAGQQEREARARAEEEEGRVQELRRQGAARQDRIEKIAGRLSSEARRLSDLQQEAKRLDVLRNHQRKRLEEKKQK